MTRPTAGQIMLAARRLIDDVTAQYDAEQAAYARGAHDGYQAGERDGYRDGYADGYATGVDVGAGRILLHLQHLLLDETTFGATHDELVELHRRHMLAAGAIPRHPTVGPLGMGEPVPHATAEDVAA
jgi:hypothetical protein